MIRTPRPLLDALIAAAKNHAMSPAEIQQQRISAMMGFLPHDSKTTREQIAEGDYKKHGNLTEMEANIKRLTQALGAACDALKGLLPMAEQAATQVPHDGSCGPWESCDAQCMEAHYDSRALLTARDFIREHAK